MKSSILLVGDKISYIIGYKLIKKGHECNSDDEWLGYVDSVEECAKLCKNKVGCKYFVNGIRGWEEYCWWEKTLFADCAEGWDEDSYDFYEIVSRKYDLGTVHRTS